VEDLEAVDLGVDGLETSRRPFLLRYVASLLPQSTLAQSLIARPIGFESNEAELRQFILDFYDEALGNRSSKIVI
jgi:hypothetical protein